MVGLGINDLSSITLLADVDFDEDLNWYSLATSAASVFTNADVTSVSGTSTSSAASTFH